MTAPSGQTRRFRFRRCERLKRRDDITRVFKKGRSVSCSSAKLFYCDNGLSYSRIVFTFVRKFGGAVERNRAKRLGREAYRLLSGRIKSGYDLALLLYASKEPNAAPVQAGLAERMRQMKTLISRAGLG